MRILGDGGFEVEVLNFGHIDLLTSLHYNFACEIENEAFGCVFNSINDSLLCGKN
jgi:hypothetical protein